MNTKFSITRLIPILIIAICTSILFHSCKKDENKAVDRTSYYGTWGVSSNCGGFNDITIVASSNANEIEIQGLAESYTVHATVNGASFTIPSQQTYDNYTASGSGTLSSDGKTITMSYDIFGPCNDTWTKK